MKRVRSAVRSGELGSIILNPRLSRFISEVVVERKTLDYLTLELG